MIFLLLIPLLIFVVGKWGKAADDEGGDMSDEEIRLHSAALEATVDTTSEQFAAKHKDTTALSDDVVVDIEHNSDDPTSVDKS